jgi:hypothetical protein
MYEGSMAEANWTSCNDPFRLLTNLEVMTRLLPGSENYVVTLNPPNLRQLQLFAVACCRLIPEVYKYEHLSHSLLGLAESLATTLLAKAPSGFGPKFLHGAQPLSIARATEGILAIRDGRNPWSVADAVITLVLSRSARTPGRRRARQQLSNLFRDIFGLPAGLQRPSESVLSWSQGRVLQLAQVIYDERRFEGLPILGDALEEAGCAAPELLAHCRGPGPHALGCWAVDLLLARN